MSMTPRDGFVEGGNYEFLLDPYKDGVSWDLSGGTATLYLRPRNGTTLVRTGVATGTTFKYVTLVSDLTEGHWEAAWKVSKGGVTLEGEADSFSVAPSLA